MRLLISTTLFFSSIALGNTGGFADSPMDEITARGIVIEQRIEREDFDAALGLVQRHFSDLDQDSQSSHSWQTNNRKKVKLLSYIVRSSTWNKVPGDIRALILKEALKMTPMTLQLERELSYLLARTQSLEGIGTLLARAILLPPLGRYANDIIYPRVLPDWRHTYSFMLKDGHLLKNSQTPVGIFAITRSVSRWVGRFQTPDALLAEVGKYSSPETLQVLQIMIAGNPLWSFSLSAQQINRFNYWARSKGCEAALLNPTQPNGPNR